MFFQSAVRNRLAGFDILATARSRLLWCLLVVVLVGGRHLFANGADFFASVGGTDDATRLYQLREFLTSAAWFDLELSQIGAPEALQSHWSRLVDLPLGLSISFLDLFVDDALATTIVRVVWPCTLLLGLVWLVARDVERSAGTVAVVIALFMIFNSVSATFQFHPGRVDHHNVQILCAIGGVLLLHRSLSEPWYGFPAGGLIGLGIVVGFEALLPVVVIIAIALILAGFVREMRQGVRRALRSCTGVMLCGFVLTTPVSQWAAVECDALSLNLLMLFAIGTVTMTVLKLRLPNASPVQWISGLGIGGVMGLATYVALEPVCVGGPLAKIDPAAQTVWLSHVNEIMSVARFAEISPTGAFSYIAIVACGVGLLGHDAVRSRDGAALFRVAALLVVAIYGCLYVRLMPYAIWLAIPAIAVWVVRLPAIGSISQTSVRVALTLVLSQGTLIALFAPVVAVFGSTDADAVKKMTPLTKICNRNDTIAALNMLPAGLVANETDLGPYIALHTRHRVVAAPYHRIDKSIVAAHRIFTSAPRDSEALLRRLGANYVVVCKRSGDRLTAVKAGTLMHALQHGQAVPFLAPVATGKPDSPLLVFRINASSQ